MNFIEVTNTSGSKEVINFDYVVRISKEGDYCLLLMSKDCPQNSIKVKDSFDDMIYRLIYSSNTSSVYSSPSYDTDDDNDDGNIDELLDKEYLHEQEGIVRMNPDMTFDVGVDSVPMLPQKRKRGRPKKNV